MKYYVTFAVDGTITTEIEANSDEEAKNIIFNENVFPGDADFGNLENSEAELIQVEREDGETIYEY